MRALGIYSPSEEGIEAGRIAAIAAAETLNGMMRDKQLAKDAALKRAINNNMSDRRLKAIQVANPLLLDMMRTGYKTPPGLEVISGVPMDAVFVADFFDMQSQVTCFVFEHPSFEPVPLGAIIPRIDVNIRILPTNPWTYSDDRLPEINTTVAGIEIGKDDYPLYVVTHLIQASPPIWEYEKHIMCWMPLPQMPAETFVADFKYEQRD